MSTHTPSPALSQPQLSWLEELFASLGKVAAPKYIPTLDGWRAIAIIAVILSHARNELFVTGGLLPSPLLHFLAGYGGLGVDIFFGLSGFLITSRLMQEAATHGAISLRAFYIRRVFRILPASTIYLVFLGLIAALGVITLERWELPSCLFFARNYFPMGLALHDSYTGHFWSLAVEEHFYIFWPTLLAILGARRGFLAAVGLALTVHVWRAIDARLLLFVQINNQTGIDWRTDTRMDALLWGCAAALAFATFRQVWDRIPILRWWPVIPTLFVLAVAFNAPMLLLVQGVLIACMIAGTVAHPDTPLGRLLENPALRWVGRLSYSLYIWHVLFTNTNGGFPLSPLQHFPISVAAMFACAALSYYLIEQPLIKVGHRLAANSTRREKA